MLVMLTNLFSNERQKKNIKEKIYIPKKLKLIWRGNQQVWTSLAVKKNVRRSVTLKICRRDGQATVLRRTNWTLSSLIWLTRYRTNLMQKPQTVVMKAYKIITGKSWLRMQHWEASSNAHKQSSKRCALHSTKASRSKTSTRNSSSIIWSRIPFGSHM